MKSLYQMQYRAICTAWFLILTMVVLYFCPIYLTKLSEPIHFEDVKPKEPSQTITDVVIETKPIAVDEVVAVEEPKPVVEEVCPLTQKEIELIALVTMAECGGEPEKGQRLVIDTILNRVDSPYFPDTVHDVLYQENQYSCVWNGALDTCYVRDDLVQLIKEESVNRTNSEVVFFRTKYYHSFGVPMFQVGHHYFSKYA